MNSLTQREKRAEPSPAAPELMRFPLYQWWRHAVVDSVDHKAVIKRIVEESGLTWRYLFMTMMSAGIAVLGLLLSSPAVVIGAMLISPLMGPILGIGFGLAIFDFPELRRAGIAFAFGCVLAIVFAGGIVLASPLQATTPEILSRTRPSLFDLLVALFAALAGTFAIIRGRGETIVGVAIATALMPPLAVIGYGLATWNVPVLLGSLALFGTNFLTIALSATLMAHFYGFGHHLSRKQTMMQTAFLLGAFAAMSAPLALALSQIAREALFVREVRAGLGEQFGPDARITQLDVDFHQQPWAVRSVVIVPRSQAAAANVVRRALQARLEEQVSLDLDQIVIDPSRGEQAEREAVERANVVAADGSDAGARIARLLSVAAGIPEEQVVVDREHQRAIAVALPLPSDALATYFALEQRVAAAAHGWTIMIVPPRANLPAISFGNGTASLAEGPKQAAVLSGWAARRWNIPALIVPGLPPDEMPNNELSLAQRRARSVAALLREQGVGAVPGPAAGSKFTLGIPGVGA